MNYANIVNKIGLQKPRTTGIFALALVLGASSLASIGHAGVISTTSSATFGDISNPSTAAAAITMYHGGYSLIPGAVSFSLNSSGILGLAVIKNINGINFSTVGATSVHLANPTSSPETISFLIHDTADRGAGATFTLPPNSSQDYTINYQVPGNGAAYGMSALPNPFPNSINFNSLTSNGFDFQHVACHQIYAISPSSSTVVVNVSNIQEIPAFTIPQLLTGVCDLFGQSTLATSENHVNSVSDLTSRLSSEQSTLSSEGAALQNVDNYGGSISLPAQKATGRFYMTQVSGKWWMVTPLGHLFFENGIDEVDPAFNATILDNRGYMFQNLPTVTDPLAANYGTFQASSTSPVQQTYNHYTANLQQKYGTSSWHQPWFNTQVSRMKAWGFNAFGPYSDRTSIQNNQLPYIANLTDAGNYASVSSGIDYWGSLPDPYDPSFATVMLTNMRSLQVSLHSDPNCIGVFSGIEKSWEGVSSTANGYPMQDIGIAINILAQNGANSPAKANLVALMQRKYGYINRLNAYWMTRFKSWQDFSAPVNLGTKIDSIANIDLRSITVSYFKQYFSVVRSAIKQVDPQLMYMGTVVTESFYNPLLLQGAAGSVDSMCLNYYGTTLPSDFLAQAQKFKVPVVITENSVGSPDAGMFSSGLVSALNEQDRANIATNYLNQALTNSMIVGCNWYKMVDQPLLGGLFGYQGANDNFNQGLVDTTDTPYAPLVNAFRTTNSNLYNTRYTH